MDSVKRLFGKTDYADFIEKNTKEQLSGTTQYTHNNIVKKCGTVNKSLLLDCNTGKLLKYLLRIELNRYKISSKTDASQKSLQIIKCDKATKKCILNVEYLSSVANEIQQKIAVIIKKIDEYALTKSTISFTDLQDILGIKSLDPVALNQQYDKMDTLMVGGGRRRRSPGECGGGHVVLCLIIFGVGIGFAAASFGGSLAAAIIIILFICYACSKSQKGGGMLDGLVMPIANLKQDIEKIINIFTIFKVQVEGIGSGKEIDNICVSSENCMDSDTKFILKKILEKIDDVFEDTPDDASNTPN